MGNAASVGLRYPIIAVHQIYVKDLIKKPPSGPRDGLQIPKWLHEKAGLKYGEKIVLTREHCEGRDAEALRNRTITPVFPCEGDHARAIGPAALFLGKPGPSCLIAYGSVDPHKDGGGLDEAASVDLSFPYGNTGNNEKDLEIRARMGTKIFSKIDDRIYSAMRKPRREVLVSSISGLVVEEGDSYCNPLLAQIPARLMERAGLPKQNIEAFFSSSSKGMPALASYAVPSNRQSVTMSGALFGAFPVGDEFVINVYGSIDGNKVHAPALLHLER